MPGPSLSIRQQVPIATASNDGLMSAAQAVLVSRLPGPVIVWTGGQNFTSVVLPKLQALNFVANVWLVNDATTPFFDIPAGTWQFQNVVWVGLSDDNVTPQKAQLRFLVGAFLDSSQGSAVLRLTTVMFSSQASITKPNDYIYVFMNATSQIDASSSGPMFASVGNIFFKLERSSQLNPNGAYVLATAANTSAYFLLEILDPWSVVGDNTFGGSVVAPILTNLYDYGVNVIQPTVATGAVIFYPSIGAPTPEPVAVLRFADGVIVANVPVMPSTTNPYNVVAWDGTDLVAICGVTITASTAAGQVVQVIETRGQLIQFLNSGATVITPGELLKWSTTSIGRVTTTGNGAKAGYARSAAAATVDAPVYMTF